ncbi:hypothetical protein JCM8547_005255 [Rhodosporidiobolus lusitaniae]
MGRWEALSDARIFYGLFRELVNDELESAKKAVASKYTCAPCKLQGGPAELDGILECERNFRTEGMMSSLWEESRKSVSSLLSDFHISSPYWELVDVKEAWSDGFDGLAALTYLPPGQPKLLVSRARSDISPMSGMCHTVRSVDLRVPASADSRLLFFVKFFRLKVVDPTPRSPVTKEGSDEGEEEQNEEDIRPSWQFWATAWFID